MSNANDFVIEDGVLKKFTGKEEEVLIPEGVTYMQQDSSGYMVRIDSSETTKTCSSMSLKEILQQIQDLNLDE